MWNQTSVIIRDPVFLEDINLWEVIILNLVENTLPYFKGLTSLLGFQPQAMGVGREHWFSFVRLVLKSRLYPQCSPPTLIYWNCGLHSLLMQYEDMRTHWLPVENGKRSFIDTQSHYKHVLHLSDLMGSEWNWR